MSRRGSYAWDVPYCTCIFLKRKKEKNLSTLSSWVSAGWLVMEMGLSPLPLSLSFSFLFCLPASISKQPCTLLSPYTLSIFSFLFKRYLFTMPPFPYFETTHIFFVFNNFNFQPCKPQPAIYAWTVSWIPSWWMSVEQGPLNDVYCLRTWQRALKRPSALPIMYCCM